MTGPSLRDWSSQVTTAQPDSQPDFGFSGLEAVGAGWGVEGGHLD